MKKKICVCYCIKNHINIFIYRYIYLFVCSIHNKIFFVSCRISIYFINENSTFSIQIFVYSTNISKIKFWLTNRDYVRFIATLTTFWQISNRKTKHIQKYNFILLFDIVFKILQNNNFSNKRHIFKIIWQINSIFYAKFCIKNLNFTNKTNWNFCEQKNTRTKQNYNNKSHSHHLFHFETKSRNLHQKRNSSKLRQSLNLYQKRYSQWSQ